jgi:hypothetical protein
VVPRAKPRPYPAMHIMLRSVRMGLFSLLIKADI